VPGRSRRRRGCRRVTVGAPGRPVGRRRVRVVGLVGAPPRRRFGPPRPNGRRRALVPAGRPRRRATAAAPRDRRAVPPPARRARRVEFGEPGVRRVRRRVVAPAPPPGRLRRAPEPVRRRGVLRPLDRGKPERPLRRRPERDERTVRVLELRDRLARLGRRFALKWCRRCGKYRSTTRPAAASTAITMIVTPTDAPNACTSPAPMTSTASSPISSRCGRWAGAGVVVSVMS